MDLSSIFDFVIGLIEQVINFVVSIISDLISILVQVFGYIWNVIVNLVNALVSLFQKIATFFVHLWQDYIKPAISGLVKLYKAIHDWLQKVLGPILRIIQRIRQFYYQYIFKWVQLAQQVLSVLRTFLTVLRALGVKWAAQLDADIAKIQGYITQITSGIVATLNQASTWLNFAVDPAGIFRTSMFRNTMFANLSSVYRSVNWGKNRYLSASEAQNTQEDRNLMGAPAAILTRNADGSVTYSDASQRMNAGFTDGWNSFGPPKV